MRICSALRLILGDKTRGMAARTPPERAPTCRNLQRQLYIDRPGQRTKPVLNQRGPNPIGNWR